MISITSSYFVKTQNNLYFSNINQKNQRCNYLNKKIIPSSNVSYSMLMIFKFKIIFRLVQVVVTSNMTLRN